MNKNEVIENLKIWMEKFDGVNFKICEDGGFFLKYTANARNKFEIERDFDEDINNVN